MKTRLILILFVNLFGLFSFKLTAQKIQCDWVNNSSTDGSSVNIVNSDGENNTIICGNFGKINFGIDTINKNNGCGFVAKYSSTGNLMWYKIFESSKNCYVRSMVTNNLGEIYSLVTASGVISIDSSITTDSTYHLILTKHDKNGNLGFAKVLSSPDGVGGVALNIDSNFNILLLWENSTYTTIGNTTISGNGYYKLAKFDSTGQLKWSKCLNNKIYNLTGTTKQAFTIGPNNSILITGNFRDTMLWGSSLLSNPLSNAYCGFTAKLDSNGNEVWAKKVGSTFFQGEYICSDNINNIYNCGLADPTQNFSNPNSVIIPASQNRWVIVHQDINGNYINHIHYPDGYWVRYIKINGPYLFIALEAYGHYVPPYQNTNYAVIYKCDLNLNFIDSIRFTNINIAFSIDFDQNGKILMGGIFQDYANIGNCTFATNSTYANAFYVSKFSWNSTVNTNTSLKDDDFQIFPNPTNSFFQLVDNSNSLNGSLLQIFDFNGRKVQESIISNSSNKIDISNLKSGVYILHLSNEKMNIHKKIIKM